MVLLFIYFSGNDNNSPDVQYVSSTSEHAIDYFDSKNITGIHNMSEDPSLNRSDDANNILQNSDLSLLDILSSLQKDESFSWYYEWVLLPWVHQQLD